MDAPCATTSRLTASSSRCADRSVRPGGARCGYIWRRDSRPAGAARLDEDGFANCSVSDCEAKWRPSSDADRSGNAVATSLTGSSVRNLSKGPLLIRILENAGHYWRRA